MTAGPAHAGMRPSRQRPAADLSPFRSGMLISKGSWEVNSRCSHYLFHLTAKSKTPQSPGVPQIRSSLGIPGCISCELCNRRRGCWQTASGNWSQLLHPRAAHLQRGCWDKFSHHMLHWALQHFWFEAVQQWNVCDQHFFIIFSFGGWSC